MKHIPVLMSILALPSFGQDYFATHTDKIPNYVRIADTETVQDGLWLDPATWSAGVPTATSNALISHNIVLRAISAESTFDFGDLNQNGQAYDAEDIAILDPVLQAAVDSGDFTELRQLMIDAQTGTVIPSHGTAVAEAKNMLIAQGGKLSHCPMCDTKLTVTTMQVLGTYEVGTEAAPIQKTAELVIRDAPFDYQLDPEQFGHGLLVIGGKIETKGIDRGKRFAEYPGPVPAEWQPGDTVFLPDTRPGKTDFSQAECITLEAIDSLQFSHEGVDVFQPHIANLTSNIVFRSENPLGVRGHVLYTGRAEVSVHDVVFKDLGRTTVDQLDITHMNADKTAALYVGTNQIARYSSHCHHLLGPLQTESPYQFEFVSNVIWGGEKWGQVQHGSHYGLIENCAIVGVQGAGIVFEDGSETENVVENNFVALLKGSGLSDIARNEGSDPVLVGDGSPGNPFRTVGDNGHGGTGIWMRGSNNRVRNNVVADAAFAGMFVWSRSKPTVTIPAAPGEMPSIELGLRTMLPLEYHGNEVYSTYFGYSFLGAGQDTEELYSVSDLSAWNVYFGCDISYSGNIKFTGCNLLGYGEAQGFSPAFVNRFYADNCDVRNFKSGLTFGGSGEVSNSYFDNAPYNIALPYHFAEGAKLIGTLTEPTPYIVRNVTFGDRAKFNIREPWGYAYPDRSYTYPRDVLVYNYNGVQGDDFLIYAPEQSPEFVMPYSGMGNSIAKDRKLSPVKDATNGQLWDEYRIAPKGRLLPDDAVARPKISGLTTPIPADLTPPVISHLQVETTPTAAVISWTTDKPATSQVEWLDRPFLCRSYGFLTQADTELKTEHSVTLTGLEPGKTYYFDTYSHDAAGNAGGYDYEVGSSILYSIVPTFVAQ